MNRNNTDGYDDGSGHGDGYGDGGYGRGDGYGGGCGYGYDEPLSISNAYIMPEMND